MFPLRAKDGGVLVRDGHTEATVDLAKLAGLKPCGLCCEIMREDGTMMRTTELLQFAEKHDLTVITITDIIEYRLKNESLIRREADAKLPTKYGNFEIYGYENILNGDHHVALVMGDVADGEPGTLPCTFRVPDRRCVWFQPLRLWRTVRCSNESHCKRR